MQKTDSEKSIYQKLADATFQVVCGQSRGSGFSFLHENIAVTNLHVVKDFIDLERGVALQPVELICESGSSFFADIISCSEINDYAVLKLTTPLANDREILQPASNFIPSRGKKLLFSGYPHGLPSLLTSEGIISSTSENGQFYIDGMINRGNSGGPIIDVLSGDVVGIVTARRYIDKSEELMRRAQELLTQTRQARKTTMVISAGVDIGNLSDILTSSLSVMNEMMLLNANPGIGIGYPIQPVFEVINTYDKI